jgi:DNA-binding transcriptional regulator GbsR (MarR family)
MNEATARFVENMGSFFARSGIPRAAGQLLALLVITPGDGLTATELAESLGASAGSVSTMTRLLVHYGMLERLRLPGERRDRYRLRPDALEATMEQGMRDTTQMRVLMEEALQLVTDQQTRSRVQDQVEFYAFFEREMIELVDKWRNRR